MTKVKMWVDITCSLIISWGILVMGNFGLESFWCQRLIAYPAGTSVSVAGTIYAGLTACFIKCVVTDLPTRRDFLPLTPASSLRKLCRSHQKSLFGGTTEGQHGQIHSQETWIMLAWEILCSSDGISVENVEMKEMLKIHLLPLILVLIFWLFAVMGDS